MVTLQYSRVLSSSFHCPNIMIESVASDALVGYYCWIENPDKSHIKMIKQIP